MSKDIDSGSPVERRLTALGLDLPNPFAPVGSYVNAVQAGELLVLGGHVPVDTHDQVVFGKLGADLSVAAGREAARLAGLSALSTIREVLGGLDRVRRILSLRGVVNATPDFLSHTQVIDGASDVFIELFGDAGKHARLAVGVNSLPANIALEIELLVEVDSGNPVWNIGDSSDS
ncbi:RidA family protein [Pseudonocardia spinosispora]|uniref:RidA family protein n=1 Tax=Pseudonocardia spinosispora TaxID=103441 RepID=UPI000424C7E7|nr:RidA family protein [Pseudonocardia spinosispora]